MTSRFKFLIQKECEVFLYIMLMFIYFLWEGTWPKGVILLELAYLPREINRRYSRRVFTSWKFTIQHWVNLLIYLQKELLYFNIARRTWFPSSEIICIRFFEDIEKIEDRMVEGSELLFNFSNPFTLGSESSIGNERKAILYSSAVRFDIIYQEYDLNRVEPVRSLRFLN